MSTTAVKEHPILFSGEMVRAILDGRKTQTRRVVKRKGWLVCGAAAEPYHAITQRRSGKGYAAVRTECYPCPYGQPGDRLWVRETWAETVNIDCHPDWPGRPHTNSEVDEDGLVSSCVIYRADGGWNWLNDIGYETDRSSWRPSIHMPRWASRITLEVTDVRVERVQDISEADVQVEGTPNEQGIGAPDQFDFQQLWDSINAKRGYGWDANPWVWVVEFEQVEAGT